MAHTGGIKEMIEIVVNKEKEPATLEEYLQRMSEEEKEKLIRYLKQKRSEGLCI